MVLLALLLQKPSVKSRCKDHSQSQGVRLVKWKDGAIDDLLLEGRTIQGRLASQQRGERDAGRIAKAFDRLVSAGNIRAATRLITEQGSGGPLMLCQQLPDGRSTKEHLLDKHPEPQPLRAQALHDGPVRSSLNHPVAFASISADEIRQTIQWMSVAGKGSASHSSMPQTIYVWPLHSCVGDYARSTSTLLDLRP